MDPRIWIRLLAYAQRPPATARHRGAPEAWTRTEDAACLATLRRAVEALIRHGGARPARSRRLRIRTLGATTGFDVLTTARVIPARWLSVRLHGAGVDCSYGAEAAPPGTVAPAFRISFDDADPLAVEGAAGRLRFATLEQLGQHVLEPLLAR